MRDPKGPVKPYKTPKEISKKHNVSLDKIIQQVKMGTKVEGEHTTSTSGARITALQHVDELPNYYTKLKKVEKKSTKKESTEMSYMVSNQQRYCPKCKKLETSSECQYGENYWKMYSIPASLAPKKFSVASIHPTNESKIQEDHKEIASGKMKDDEGYMARLEMDKMERCIEILRKIINKPDHQLPAWVQSKITRAADFIDSAAEYLSSDEVSEEVIDEKKGLWDNIHARRKKGLPPKKPGEKGYPKTLDIEEDLKQAKANVGASKCWKGKKVGNPPTKMKGGKEVPNCVPAEDTCLSFSEFMVEVAAWQRKEGKNPEGGLNRKGIASYRRENPGSKLSMAVTTPPSKLDPDSKAAKRRKSFCARMGGVEGPMKDEKGRPTRKALSLRKWNC